MDQESCATSLRLEVDTATAGAPGLSITGTRMAVLQAPESASHRVWFGSNIRADGVLTILSACQCCELGGRWNRLDFFTRCMRRPACIRMGVSHACCNHPPAHSGGDRELAACLRACCANPTAWSTLVRVACQWQRERVLNERVYRTAVSSCYSWPHPIEEMESHV